ncbi:farnesyl diphosphate synthase [Andreprevotia lacus DSM 23236]|jgi:farnesyl diphosphate synthase|uniref:Farnesyl diphosphate synthase n=1 Tax=Andreprevotia lacus DSM 23236 TaxID=1121001 RepID=A0A1W1XPN4_9NEIS|nr:farnesyl diphosphate synthase [Andreprevotia lacus]SMC25919.1 farnesyl diphosphate synthase [Andreprevotia lacus DSM 23236]
MIAAGADFKTWMSAVQARIETVLENSLPTDEHMPARLHQAMRYAVLDGGKRVRPLLVFAAGELVGADPARLDHAAAAVELIHAYSLVHDDMPAMDNDVLRRGKPTVHVAFDEATALLAGDALQTAAFESLSKQVLTDDARDQIAMVHLLAKASGSHGMCGGQGIDLYSVGKALTLPELELMHILKTGALIRASVLLGAHCGSKLDAAALAGLDHAAKCVGLAFQVIDDILDCEADSATLGKTAGKDAANDKPTYVSLLGLPAAKEKAAELQREAHAALDALGANAARLKQVADFIVARRS